MKKKKAQTKKPEQVSVKRTKIGRMIAVNGLFNKANLNIIASPTDWEKLAKNMTSDSEHFEYDFFFLFVWPAIEKIERTRSEKQEAIKAMKRMSCLLHDLFKACYNLPSELMPEPFKKLIKKVKAKEDTKIDEKELTWFCLEFFFKDSIEKFGLKPFENPANFYQTYIRGNKHLTQISRMAFEGRSISDLDLSFRKPPLLKIFQKTRVL